MYVLPHLIILKCRDNDMCQYKITFTLLLVGLKTAQKINQTGLRLHQTGTDMFENVAFTPATRTRTLSKRCRTKTERHANAVVFWCRL